MTVPLSGGRSIRTDLKKTPVGCTLELVVPEETTAILELPEGYTRIKVNGKLKKQGARLKKGRWQICFIR